MMTSMISSQAQVLRSLGGELIEKTFKISGKKAIKSSDVILEKALKKSGLKVLSKMGRTKAARNINVVKYFTKILDDIGEKAFNKKYIFQQSGDVLLIKNKKGRYIASINDNIITAKPWKGGSDLNPFLNEHVMIPNSIYKINGQSYKTSDNSLYKEMSGVLISLSKNKPARSIQMQGLSKKIKGGVVKRKNGVIVRNKSGSPVYKDDGGHILANMFGGGSEMYNYIPMSRKLNRQGGAWAQMERKWEKALKGGQKVDYKIKPIYQGTSKRPDKIYVTYEIEGKRVTELFDNNIF